MAKCLKPKVQNIFLIQFGNSLTSDIYCFLIVFGVYLHHKELFWFPALCTLSALTQWCKCKEGWEAENQPKECAPLTIAILFCL